MYRLLEALQATIFVVCLLILALSIIAGIIAAFHFIGIVAGILTFPVGIFLFCYGIELIGDLLV